MNINAEATKAAQEDLLKQFNLAKAPEAVIIHKTEKSVEDYKSIPNNQTIHEVQVPYSENRLLWRQEPNGTKVPCRASWIAYNTAIFKSKVRETFGLLVKGTSIYIVGYDVAMHANGTIMTEDIPNPLHNAEDKESEEPETIRVPKLITEDKDGKPLEPKILMTFRPQFGTDLSKQKFTRLKDRDMLNLVPNIGVPRKSNTTLPAQAQAELATDSTEPVDHEEATRRSDAIDWALIPSLQPEIERPLINAHLEGNSELLSFIENIPLASNAPSLKAQQAAGATAFTSPVATAAAGVPHDPFAAAPEAAATEATEEVETVTDVTVETTDEADE